MKREALIRLLRRYARRRGLRFELDVAAGKGSHYGVRLDTRYSTLQSGELGPIRVERILKQLGVDPEDL